MRDRRLRTLDKIATFEGGSSLAPRSGLLAIARWGYLQCLDRAYVFIDGKRRIVLRTRLPYAQLAALRP